MKLKLCIDCMYFVHANSKCGHVAAQKPPDYVRGHPTDTYSAETMRVMSGAEQCGPEAKYFLRHPGSRVNEHLQPERVIEPNPDAEDEAYDRARQKELDEQQPVRFSHLKAYGRSPAHGHYARTNDSEETYAMERGTAVHALVFGTKRVIGFPGKKRAGKEYESFAIQNHDAEILTMSEYDKARRMADAVLSSVVAAPFLNGTAEQKLLFKWMGLDCRVTPDVRGAGFVTELKSAQSADPSKFVWQARRMAYHAQLRFQEYGCVANKHKVSDHYIVCVESDPPHPVIVYHLEPEAREEGEKLLTLWAERLKNCEASNVYPPYVDCVVPLVWPKDDFELEYE